MDIPSTGDRPVPKPRRTVTPQNSNPPAKIEYENVEIKGAPIEGKNLIRPNKDEKNAKREEEKAKGLYKHLILELSDMNNEKEDNRAGKVPVAAPRKTQNTETKPQNYTNVDVKPPPSRKAPEIPDRVKNDMSKTSPPPLIKKPSNDSSIFYGDGPVEAGPSTTTKRVHRKSLTESIVSTSSTNSTHSSTEHIPQKYKTTSPGDLLKSLGATSKMLTSSIGERVAVRTKGARHKLDKSVKQSREKLETWGLETQKSVLKNVRKKIGGGNSIDNSSNSVDFMDGGPNNERPKTLPVNDEMLNSIKFNSPLNNKASNCVDLSRAESSYEIPKRSYDVSSLDSLPSYNEVVTGNKFRNLSITDSDSSLSLDSSASLVFERNAPLTQSMEVTRKSPYKELQRMMHRNKSESNIYKLSSHVEEPAVLSPAVSSDDDEQKQLPCPTMPAPVLKPDQIYGKINPARSRLKAEAGDQLPMLPVRPDRRKKSYENVEIRNESISSTRVTCDTTGGPNIFSRQAVVVVPPATIAARRCLPEKNTNSVESWSFYDSTTVVDNYDPVAVSSGSSNSPEPLYTNNENNNNSEALYGRLIDMDSENDRFLLKPQKPNEERTSNPIAPNMFKHDDDAIMPSTSSGGLLVPTRVPNAPSNPKKDSILEEFDPLLVRRSVETILAAPNSSTKNNLTLLERLLSDDTYGETVDDDNNDVIRDDDTTSISAYSEEDNETVAAGEEIYVPTPPERIDSLSTLDVEPPSRGPPSPSASSSGGDFMIIHQNMSLRSESIENIVDESVIQPHLARRNDENNLTTGEFADLSRPSPNRTNWFLADGNGGTVPPIEGDFTKQNRIDSINRNTSTKNVDKVSKSIPKLSIGLPPPTYNEAVGGATATPETPTMKSSKGYTEKGSIAEDYPLPPNPVKNSSSMKNMFSSVLKGMEGININLRRKNSLKQDTKTLIEMIPKPQLSQRYIRHEGHLIRFPLGVVEDILKELSPRNCILAEKQFSAYLDPGHKQLKERFLLDYITTIQCVNNQKLSNTPDMHCFEITIGLPRNNQQGHQALSNPNMIISSTSSVNVKAQRVCHLYGIAKRSERNVWMQKLIESMTDVFPQTYTCEYTRAGWCYLKSSISSQWSGAFVLLSGRKLLFWSSAEGNLEMMDLRKARCIVLKEGDDSLKNLHVEKGPMLMIDCPPYTEYIIMNCPRETKIWRHIIKESAHNNGQSLKRQQLTKDNVPVIVDKCINFVYTHGSMSEGVYRKSGSEAAIAKLLTAFRSDAFSVQITRTEYTENDIANVLKRFMRDLPERLLERHAVSFLSISEMKSVKDKISAYKELLSRLPVIEYQTLKKLIGHLNFIQSQKNTNKMGVNNLSLIWGLTLLRKNREDDVSFYEGDSRVVADLIVLYKNLFHLTNDEITKEQIMLSVLQKYHAAAENLSDSVKQSGDLKLWITIDPRPDHPNEEKKQINVSLTPTKTVHDVCKELSNKMKIEAHNLTLNEIILDGELERPMHYSELVLDTVLRWTAWPDPDRKSNYLKITPTKFLDHISRSVRSLGSIIPNSELKFVDTKTRSLKPYTVELLDNTLTVSKKDKNNVIVKVNQLWMTEVVPYIGSEKKRDMSQTRWSITFIEKGFKKRNRDAPYIGHVLAGTNSNDLIVWYSHILYGFYRNNILPNPEMVIP